MTDSDHDILIQHSVKIDYISKIVDKVDKKMDILTQSCNHKLSKKISWFQLGTVFTIIGVIATVIILAI